MTIAGPDLGCPASVSDPAGYFAGFRGSGPIQWSEAQRGWVVLGHQAVLEAFRERDVLSADRIGPLERIAADQPATFETVVELLRGWMIFRDPPAHTRLREPVRSAFTPRHVGDLTSAVDRIAQTVVDDLARVPGDSVDLSRDFARPLPAMVIARLLGVDELDRTRLQEWSDALAAIVFAVSPTSTVPADSVIAAAEAFDEFFGPLVERARRDPGDDLVSRVAAIDSGFSPRELVGLCTLLLFAGHETTTGLLVNALGLMLEDAERLDRFRSGSSADDALAVEEFLRVQGPARTMVRKVARAHERHGRRLQVGDNVFVAIVAANHDPAVFDDPGIVDLRRDPNPQVGFGWGLHHCLGAHLARLETRLALRALVDAYPALRSDGPVPPIAGSVLGHARGTIRAVLD